MARFRRTALSLVIAATAFSARADEGDYPSVKFSGFLSVVGGKVLAGSPEEATQDVYGVDRPFYIADWANWGTYDKSFSLKPESRIGVQALVKFTDELSFTGQVMSRGTLPDPSIQWAYLSYAFTPSWELQVGRKRIPLYYYSDFQDIGVAYPWVTPPPELYGWEATNYNGASLRHKASIAGAVVTMSVFGGKETVKESRYMWSVGQTKTDVTWDHILGGDMEVTKSWLTVRGIYMTSDNTYTDRLDPTNNGSQKMKAYGLAANADLDQWFVLSEYGKNNRTYDGYYLDAPCFSLGCGVRLGSWTPFLNYGKYGEHSNDPSYEPVNWKRGSLTVRYDLTPSHSIKVQVDRYLEINGTSFTSDATVLRVSFDMVF